MPRIVEAPATPAARLFARQRHLIALLHALGGDVPCVDFQKMLLLYCKSLGDASPYEFVPYRFGAFSFTSYADRRKLAERRFLDDADTWRLSAAGWQLAETINLPVVTEFAKQNRHLAGDALVAETYRRFPYLASKSEIVSRVLRNDAAAKRRIVAAAPRPTGSPLMTIGYEGRSVEAYLNVLLLHGVTVLCDVRRNPLSRKYGFSKRSLMAACEGVGICYRHLPELGIVGDRRRSLDTQADYDRLFEDYERHDLPHQGATITAIGNLLRPGERVALTCYEHLPHQCHRHCVAEAVERLPSCECGAVHL